MAQFDSIRFQPSRPLLKEVSADRLNAILSEIKKNRPRGERGITVRQSGDATYIGLAAVTGDKAVRPGLGPWDLSVRNNPYSEGNYMLTVTPGMLNGFLPTNWDVEEEAKDVEVNAGGLYYAKAVVATDGQIITQVSIEIDQTPPPAQTPQPFGIEAEIKYLFGLFFDGLAYRTVAAGHLTLTTHQWLVKSPSSPAQPGEIPYEILYVLV